MISTDNNNKLNKIIELMTEDKLEICPHNVSTELQNNLSLIQSLEFDFDDCDYYDIIRTAPYSLEHDPLNQQKNQQKKSTKKSTKKNQQNDKQKRSQTFYNQHMFAITDEFIECIKDIGFPKTITKIFYYYFEPCENMCLSKIFGKSIINNHELYFYTEYEDNSMGFSDHKLYFSYDYQDITKYCMPNYHVARFLSLYDV